MKDVVRDLGIAFIVACVVGTLIELYRFVQHYVHSMREMIDITMSDRISSDVWIELSDVIEATPAIRKNMLVRIELVAEDRAAPAQLLVEHYYELHGLPKRRSKRAITHELGYELRDSEQGFPRFTKFTINSPSGEDRSYTADDLAAASGQGRVSENVWLQPRDGPPAKVQIDRIELAWVPGSYNIYTASFVKGLDVVVAKLPVGVDVEVWIRPQGPGESLKQIGNTWSSDQLMLPGQGIEIKFLRREPNTAAGISNESPPVSASTERIDPDLIATEGPGA